MQGPALRIAREMGLETVVADADPEALCVSLADRFERVDLKDKEGIEALAHSLKAENGLGGIMTAGTDFSATVAWTAERLKLPGISYEAALDASDKGRMRERFKEAGLPSPKFLVVQSQPAEGFSFPFSFPMVVKPVDNMGARGCRKVDSLQELNAAVNEALAFSRSGRAIVEEYMEGPEFSVDALVYQGEIIICGLADRHIFFPPYFIEMGHTMPTTVDPAIISLLLETFCQGVKALGISNGAAKGDIKLTNRGPMIGEIAARLSGGYMSGWTYPYSSGVLPARGAIEIALGNPPSGLHPKWNWVAAERAFISIPGRIRSIEGIEMAKVMPLVKDVFTLVKPGSYVSFPENNVSKCGNVISAAEDREDAIYSAESAARSILIRLETPNTKTDAFLALPPAGARFPPDAFPVDSRLLSLLEALPENLSYQTLGLRTLREISGVETSIFPFPEFTGSRLTDYVGRSIQESLNAVRTLTGMKLPFADKDSSIKRAKEGANILGRSFWQAFIRGGYQGAAYYIDSLWAEND
jgi:biotin carboxylase